MEDSWMNTTNTKMISFRINIMSWRNYFWEWEESCWFAPYLFHCICTTRTFKIIANPIHKMNVRRMPRQRSSVWHSPLTVKVYQKMKKNQLNHLKFKCLPFRCPRQRTKNEAQPQRITKCKAFHFHLKFGAIAGTRRPFFRAFHCSLHFTSFTQTLHSNLKLNKNHIFKLIQLNLISLQSNCTIPRALPVLRRFCWWKPLVLGVPRFPSGQWWTPH